MTQMVNRRPTAGHLTARINGPRIVEPLGPLDPRTAAWRPDLADIALAGLVAVPNYVEPVIMATTRQTPLFARADAGTTAVSELLPGEGFALLDQDRGFGWGYCLHDHYVGHVPLDVLTLITAEPTHMAGPGDALIFAAADIKSPIVTRLPAGSYLIASHIDASPADVVDKSDFLETANGFVHQRHLLPLAGDPALDRVDIARNYIGAPYQWGGRSRAGIDCSGLVQMVHLLSGHPCRRDSDMQAADGTPIANSEQCRGDIVWWPGHVGILTAPDRILHANAHWMRCVEEGLDDVCRRIGTDARFFRF